MGTFLMCYKGTFLKWRDSFLEACVGVWRTMEWIICIAGPSRDVLSELIVMCYRPEF